MRLLATAALAVSIALPAAAAPFSNVYFFGDSLSDTGNVSTQVNLLLGRPPAAPSVIPGPPYDSGGRFSNGPLVYADVLAAGLGADAVPSLLGGDNYAYGGARTRYQVSGAPFKGVIEQAATFRALPGAADPDALYVVWAGANNLQDTLSGRTTDVFGNPIPGIGATLGDIGGVIQSLYAEGARHFLVPNVPNLGRVPRVTGGGAPVAGVTALTLAFNTGLGTVLDTLDAALADLDLIRFDTFAALEDVVARPAFYGLTNLTQRCYSGDDLNFTGGGTVCAQPGQYLFWDGIHPTSTVHTALGRQMLQAVMQAVPEPASLPLAALGLAGLGWSRRRRTAAA